MKYKNNLRTGGFSTIILLIAILIAIFFGLNLFFTAEECSGPILDCIFKGVLYEAGTESTTSGGQVEEKQSERVTATGVYSRDKYSVKISMTFPIDGGAVKGSFDGACDGDIKGNYIGGNGGSISGTGSGSCSLASVSGSFSGSVNKTTKRIPISVTGTGNVLGIKTDPQTISVTLSY